MQKEKGPEQYVKSPLNYIGGKYKLLPQLLPLFPEKINKMVDLFCGGANVAANIKAEKILANDINCFVIDIFRAFQTLTIEELLEKIHDTINRYELSKTNKEGYLRLRKDYNSAEKKDPITLFTLVCFSFNYQFRFNSAHEYNNPFGANRSCFNEKTEENLIAFHKAIQNIRFSSFNFKDFDYSVLRKGDFLYADPPYLITTGSYNDGKRGFEGWGQEDDKKLFKLLDILDARGVMFALSNVLECNGRKNERLIEWADRYTIHHLDYSYSNSSYHKKEKRQKTSEVLITNY